MPTFIFQPKAEQGQSNRPQKARCPAIAVVAFNLSLGKAEDTTCHRNIYLHIYLEQDSIFMDYNAPQKKKE